MQKPGRLLALACTLALGSLLLPGTAQTVSSTAVISQVFGGGGNSGAVFRNDFIELYNRSPAAISLDGFSVQYASAAGSSWQVTALSGSLAPGRFYLVQEAAGAAGTTDLPEANAIGTIAMSATAGKVALVRSTEALSGSCPSGPSVLDLVGYGTGVSCFETTPAPGLSSTSAARRTDPAVDTDDNGSDFDAAAPDPRNASSVPPPPPPPPVFAAIHDIQGTGSASLYANLPVITEGIVTARKNNGFFLQTPEALADDDPGTSEGVFVFTSSQPPASAAVGNAVQVSGTVSEFKGDPNSPPLTEIAGTLRVAVLSTGNPLPAPVTITAADSAPDRPRDTLERLEGMRIHVDSLTTVSPTLGNVNEPNATGTSTGVFYGVLSGGARPFREPGIDIHDPLPTGAPCCIPRFDSNPERLRVDSDAQPGAVQLELTSGVVVTGITGVLDYSFRTYTILPDPAPAPAVTANIGPTPVPAPDASELTVGTFNMERFFDAADDPSTNDEVLTAAAFGSRVRKASLVIRTMLRLPDVLGVQEVENLDALRAVADAVNHDALAEGEDPRYEAFLFEGNDPGGIDSGVLVKTSKVRVVSVVQEGKTATFTNPATNLQDLLNDRPPVVLRAEAGSLPFTVVVNHLRSFLDIEDASAGARVRAKRAAQAQYLAALIQSLQTARPDEGVLSIGDYNAFQFNDGYADSLGTIKGNPASPDAVVLASPDLVQPDLVNLTDSSAAAPYSYVFDGNAQTLDHILVTQNLYPLLNRLAYARSNADFPETYRGDPARPERLSDHDVPVAYFRIPPPSGRGRMTALGMMTGAAPFVMAARLACGPADSDGMLAVLWPGGVFALETVASVTCFAAPGAPAPAGFNRMELTGAGVVNGEPASVELQLAAGSRSPFGDLILTIRQGGTAVLSVSGEFTAGIVEAHGN